MPGRNEQCVKCGEWGSVAVTQDYLHNEVRLVTDHQNPFCGGYLCGHCEAEVNDHINARSSKPEGKGE